jgi:hypothetical protein
VRADVGDESDTVICENDKRKSVTSAREDYFGILVLHVLCANPNAVREPTVC